MFGNLNIDDLGVYLQAAVETQIKDQFNYKYGPTGEPWPPNKTTPWYFDPNNHLRDSVAVGYGAREIVVSSNHHAFAYQIAGTYGGSRIQPHPLIPEDIKRSLWGDMLDTAYAGYFNLTLNVGRSPGRVRR